MQKIMIDLDETIVMDGYLKAVNDYKHTNYNAEDIDTYYVEDILGEEKEKFLDETKRIASNNEPKKDNEENSREER